MQDAEGKAAIHHAILNQHAVIISLLMSHPGLDLTLRDKSGMSPFAIAMTTKNNKAAQAILDREPTACEQVCLSCVVFFGPWQSTYADVLVRGGEGSTSSGVWAFTLCS